MIEVTTTIHRIRPDEGLVLRELRLRSLAESPDAFGQSHAEASQRPDLEWIRNARQSSHGDNRIWLLAERAAEPVGLVQGRKRRPGTLLLFSMWVEPDARRLGIGRALIGSLESWAVEWGGQETILWVYGGNTIAIRFYDKLGFATIRDGPDAESGASYGALAMRRDIRAPTPQA